MENKPAQGLAMQTCARGEGTQAFKQGAYQHVHFHEAAERERASPACPRTASNVPKNLPSGIPNGLHGSRNGTPKPHINRPLVTPVFEVRKEASPKPSCRGVWPAKHALLGFPNPHTPLVQISKAGPGRKLEEAFVNEGWRKLS